MEKILGVTFAVVYQSNKSYVQIAWLLLILQAFYYEGPGRRMKTSWSFCRRVKRSILFPRYGQRSLKRKSTIGKCCSDEDALHVSTELSLFQIFTPLFVRNECLSICAAFECVQHLYTSRQRAIRQYNLQFRLPYSWNMFFWTPLPLHIR